MSDDDDLRFGDVSGSTDSGGGLPSIPGGEGIINLLVQGTKAAIILYVFLVVIETLFNIPIPLV